MIPSWVEHLAEPAVAVVIFAFGRVSRSGGNEVTIVGLKKDVQELKERLDSAEKTVIAHTTLHNGYVTMQAQILQVDRKLNAVCGAMGITGT